MTQLKNSFITFAPRNKTSSINLINKVMNIKVKLESQTFGDCSPRVIIPENVFIEFENSCYTDDNIIINYVLNKCKSFRKYGAHLNEKFILWFE